MSDHSPVSLQLPNNPGHRIYWHTIPEAALGIILNQLTTDKYKTILVIADNPVSMTHIQDAVQFFSGGSREIYSFPDWETLPYDQFSPHQDIISERLTCLDKLLNQHAAIYFTTISTLLHRLAPVSYVKSHVFSMKQGDALNIDILRTRLTEIGYHAVAEVREHGEYAIRGGIIDLFAMGSKEPFRIELFDNEIDTIRTFSVETQRSKKQLELIHLLPGKEYPLTPAAIEYFRQSFREKFDGNPLSSPIYQDVSDGLNSPGIEYYLPLFFDHTTSFFDYLPNDTLIITTSDPLPLIDNAWKQINARYELHSFDRIRPILPPAEIFLNKEEVAKHLKQFAEIRLSTSTTKERVVLPFDPAPLFEMPVQNVKNYIAKHHQRVLFCVETAGRKEILLRLLNQADMPVMSVDSYDAFVDHNASCGIVISLLQEGFIDREHNICVLSESELFGKRIMQRRRRQKTSDSVENVFRDLSELQIGDPIVHIQHGIGRYLGLKTLSVQKNVGEFLTIEYQGGDKLYVPVESLHLISRYTGVESEKAPIYKLGNEQWQKAKKKAIEKIHDVAVELLELYAKRASKPGHVYDLDQEQYNAFASAFPFEETPDQQRAIEQVIGDMTSDKPMDRVVCGDVGFGKTEVAMRAAFVAAHQGKQVAVLVPTTLLAEQHYQSFQDRFANWPIVINMISRFKTAKEQKTILSQLAEGKIDIIIGTHKLLQSDIVFKNIGLIIIDEEHRFGVKQKEKLKTLRSSIDILTLTATPIPRTLNMALSGVRDLSIIATPPAKRLSVKTFLYEYNNGIIEEAIRREVLRGGQVYFLHNDLTTIQEKATMIANLVPEARPAVAHGQMKEHELERTMSDFYHRKCNVLVCSTIIESGIDIPTANTIIINDANHFGIAQLHQLRGRVGRSHHQAYAYLLVVSKKHLTLDAEKRLEAITTLDHLGIGFALSTHDMEIRGAGELLGAEQSGNMQEIGFTLYMDLLSRAVDALKTGKQIQLDEAFNQETVDINLNVSTIIPEEYIPDIQIRLQCYKRIANANNQIELDDVHIEFIDRFGLLPGSVKTLFALTALRQYLKPLGIKKLEANEIEGKVEFTATPAVRPETVIRLIQTKPLQYQLNGSTKLKFKLPSHASDERIGIVLSIMKELHDDDSR